MDRVRFIDHKGTKLLLIDFSNTSADEFLVVIDQAREVIGKQEKKSLRTLTDVTGSHYNPKVADALKEYVEHNKPYVIAGAVVGLNDLKRIIFNFINRVTGRNLKGFDDMNEAKNWLVLG